MIAILPNADSSRPLPDVCLLFKFVNHIYRREGLTSDYEMTDSEQKDAATRSRAVQNQIQEKNKTASGSKDKNRQQETKEAVLTTNPFRFTT